jgi:IS30 family transposase
MAEREEISRGVAAGQPCRQIAARLGRAPSTVSRELARNGGRHRYRAQAADAAAFGRAQRPKAAKLLVEPRLRAVVEAKHGRPLVPLSASDRGCPRGPAQLRPSAAQG